MSQPAAADVSIVPVSNDGDLAQALAIREIVFIEEQHVPVAEERDADDARAFHVLAMHEGHAIGTGRLVALVEPPPGERGQWGRVGRMAVLRANRKLKIGSKILGSLEAEAKKRGMTAILLHAQTASLEFYKRHGYEPAGPTFEEAGMPHLAMKKKL